MDNLTLILLVLLAVVVAVAISNSNTMESPEEKEEDDLEIEQELAEIREQQIAERKEWEKNWNEEKDGLGIKVKKRDIKYINEEIVYIRKDVEQGFTSGVHLIAELEQEKEGYEK